MATSEPTVSSRWRNIIDVNECTKFENFRVTFGVVVRRCLCCLLSKRRGTSGRLLLCCAVGNLAVFS